MVGVQGEEEGVHEGAQEGLDEGEGWGDEAVKVVADGDSVLVNDSPTWAQMLGLECWARSEKTVADALSQFGQCDVYVAQFGVWSAWKRIEPPSDFRSRLRSLCLLSRKVVLVTPPMQVLWGPYNQDIVRYSDIVRDTAARMSCILVDAAARMRADAIEAEEDNFIANDEHRNHYTRAGHQLVASYVSEALMKEVRDAQDSRV